MGCVEKNLESQSEVGPVRAWTRKCSKGGAQQAVSEVSLGSELHRRKGFLFPLSSDLCQVITDTGRGTHAPENLSPAQLGKSRPLGKYGKVCSSLSVHLQCSSRGSYGPFYRCTQGQ